MKVDPVAFRYDEPRLEVEEDDDFEWDENDLDPDFDDNLDDDLCEEELDEDFDDEF